MTGRWHDVAGGSGFALAETDDVVALAKWCREWSDLLTFKITPVLDDAEIAEVLAHPRPS